MNSGSIKNTVNLHGSIVSLGARGYSNYEIAVQNGFEGSEQEWLDSLVGPVGPRGPIGPNNFHVGEEEPEDENVSVWLDTDEPIPNTFVPVATEETLGTIKPGNNLKVDKYGKLDMTIYANNVEEMVNSKLKINDVVRTLGYYEPNDGGGALYLIKEKTEDDAEDKGSIHFVGDKLVAELIVENGVNVKQFGAKGDGVSDDTNVLKNCFNRAKINNKINTIYFPNGEYLITDTILEKGINGLNIVGANRDYNSNLSSTIIRNGDFTVLNAEGENTLTETNLVTRVNIEKIYFKDKEENINYNTSAIKFHYAMYLTIRDCLFGNRGKSIDIRQVYDSRFLNCDFTTGGNQDLDIPLINIDCGRHAGDGAIGWDNSNWIVFDSCRFERYRGTAIKTTSYTQPTAKNPNHNPCKGVNVNKIYLDKCKFESPYLTSKPVLDLLKTSIIYFNVEVVALDGQPEMETVIKLDEVSELFGYMSVKYYQATIKEGITFSEFNNPMIKMNKCTRFDLSILPGEIYDNYKLNYLIDITANDSTYRTININLPYSYKKKALFNTSSINLNSGVQGIMESYGEGSYNGIRMKNNIDTVDEWRFATIQNGNYNELRFLYKYGSNSSVIPFHLGGKEDDVRVVCDELLEVNKNLIFNNSLNVMNETTRKKRCINYALSIPSEGYWVKGDIIFRLDPSSGGSIGWVCVESGTPGTWKSFGTIN